MKPRKILITVESFNGFGCLWWTIPFIGLIGWSIFSHESALSILGVVGVFGIMIIVYNTYEADGELKAWIEENNNLVILFYATNSKVQSVIKERVVKELDRKVSQAYYEGPEIISDLGNDDFIRLTFNQINKVEANHPRLVQINGFSLVELIDLKDLLDIENMSDTQLDGIISQIKRFL